jgi:hypothetical protein
VSGRVTYALVASVVAVYGCVVMAGVLPRPDCPFATHLHVLCPMCGTTRAFLALFAGDVAGAFRWNPLFLGWGAASALAYVDVLWRAAGREGAGPCERGFRALAARPVLLRTVQGLVLAQTMLANTLMREALLSGDGP